jgi:hypothetical protein
MGGAFVNFEGGSFGDLHYTITTGGAASTVYGQFDRPLAFFETGLSYKRYLTIYDSIQADNPPGNAATASPGTGLSRSFLTVRIQPHERISFDVNHNYFRDIPTFDPQLVGTGLLDKYLFQGLSFGVRAEVIRKVTLYTTLGRNTRSGDPNSSLNTLYGVAFDRIWKTGLRADLHYSKFTSSFGDGSYEAISVSRNFSERYRVEVLAGQQKFIGSSQTNESSRFVTSMVDIDLGAKFFFSGGFTSQRGALQSYDQWFTTLGYRFDNRNSRKQQ